MSIKYKTFAATVQHIIDKVPARHSYVTHATVDAHERHTLTNGIETAHGCPSLKAAQRLLSLHVHCVRTR